jgi:hypothetical protein
MSIEELSRSIRWAAAGAIIVALAVWLIGVVFALASLARIAEATNQFLVPLLPVVVVLIALAVIAKLAALLVGWQARKK